MAGISFNARNGVSVGTYGNVIDASGNATLNSLTLTTPLAAVYGGIGAPITGLLKGNGSSYLSATAGLDYVSPSISSTFTARQVFPAATSVISGSINIPTNSVSNTPISGDLYGNASGLNWHNGTSNKLIAYADGTNISGTLSISISGNAVTSTTATRLAAGVAGAIAYQTGVGNTSFTAVGTSGQVLTSTAGGAPAWVNQNTLSVALAANISGVVPIVNGGTGASDANTALGNLFPVGTNGYVLTYNGIGNYTWTAQTGANNNTGTIINIQKIVYVAGVGGVTIGQTVFTTPTYVTGSGQLKVFLNGVRLQQVGGGGDYNETSSTSVTLTTGVTVNDVLLIEVDGYSTWNAIASGITYTPGGSIIATDVQNAIIELDNEKAPIASPAFSGNPTAPTQAPNTNNLRIANTAYVDSGLSLKANIASPTFTGVPLAPTAAKATNTTQLATTEHVKLNLADYTLTSALGTGAFATIANYAPLSSPAFNGTPTAPTNPTPTTSNTQIASTAFVQSAITAKPRWDYTSAQQNVSFGATTLTHSLGSTPSDYRVDAICNVVDGYNGHTVGDVVPISSISSGYSDGYSITLSSLVSAHSWVNSTQISAIINGAANTFFMKHKTTGGISYMDNTKWKLILKAKV